MSVGSNEKRKKTAADKVRKLVSEGHRLGKGKGSQVYRDAVENPGNVGSYTRGPGGGTGQSAEEVAERLKRGG